MKSSQNWTLLASMVVLVVVNGLFLIALWKGGFFTFTGSDPSSKVVAAAISLVGVFLGSIITALGILTKHSLDERNAVLQREAEDRLKLEAERNAVLQREAEDRLKLEAKRNAVLQREAEDRLKLEAAIRAVQLLATSSGQPTQPIQRVGALFSLASLGQHELTLSLVFQMLKSGEIDGGTAGGLINRAIRFGDEGIRDAAINELSSCSDKLLTETGVALPQMIMGGTSKFSPYAREWIPVALGRALVARPLNEWNEMQDQVYAIIAAFCLAWKDENDGRVKNDIAVVLSQILQAFPDLGKLAHSRELIDTPKIRSELQGVSISTATSQAAQIAKQINQWLRKDSPLPAADDKSTATTNT